MRKLTLAFLFLLISAVSAETIEVRGTGKTRDVTLKAGDSLEVRGTGNTLTVRCEGGGRIEFHGTSNKLVLTGRAEAVDVHGAANHLHLDAQVEYVNIHGSKNEVVLVRRDKRPLPKVEKHGQGNKVETRDGH